MTEFPPSYDYIIFHGGGGDDDDDVCVCVCVYHIIFIFDPVFISLFPLNIMLLFLSLKILFKESSKLFN